MNAEASWCLVVFCFVCVCVFESQPYLMQMREGCIRYGGVGGLGGRRRSRFYSWKGTTVIRGVDFGNDGGRDWVDLLALD